MKKILVLAASLSLCVLAACGGGGSSSSGGSSTSTVDYISNGASATCATSSSSSSTNLGTNVAAVIVDQGPTCLTSAGQAAANTLFVSVTICVPGKTDSSNCQTIDHVQVDTGSTGLRILSSVLTVSNFVNTSVSGGGALGECMQYVDGVAWGPVTSADVYIGGATAVGSGEKAANLPVQIIGGKSNDVPATPPTACTTGTGGSTLTVENTVATFGANGIIGIGAFQQDCGACCDSPSSCTSGNPGYYYACTNSSCSVTTQTLATQVSNPVSSFTTDNNGTVISLPTVGSAGAANVGGTLTFGIGTQSNNAQPAGVTLLYMDPAYDEFTTTLNGTALSASYIDSGSNALFFDSSDSALLACKSTTASGFYCPTSTLSFTASLTSYSGSGAGTGGASNASQAFSIASADSLFNNSSGYAAFNDLGGSMSSVASGTTTSNTSSSSTFDWGLAFFYGANVYTSIQPSADASNSPYVAFIPNNGTVLN